ncbi:MAG: DNA-processing protein DprA [Clostridia bacterium]|nr:DNA-processing protein DprA [Clostridia bacterium]
MNKDTVYWVWIQRALGYGSARTNELSESFSFAEDFYRLPYTDKLKAVNFTAAEAARLKTTPFSEAENIVRICKDRKIDIVSLSDDKYPILLKSIHGSPAVLYVRGDIGIANARFCISIVGTRNASASGKKYSREIARDLAIENVCIVSGGAKGIDHFSHLGALDAGGVTICVLGCGHEVGYLREFDKVKQEIINKGGAVISEYPPLDPPSKLTFPVRNRIISGLSRGVVIVEAGKRSGSSITAGTALEQGRDVFALANEVSAKTSEGTRALIFDGAIPIRNALDIIIEYLAAFPNYRDNVLLSNIANCSENGIIQRKIGNFLRDVIDDKCSKEKLIDSILTGIGEDSYSVYSQEKENNDVEVRMRQRPDFLEFFHEMFSQYLGIENEPQIQTEQEETASAADDIVDVQSSSVPEMSPNASEVLRVLRGGALHIDKIAEKTGLSIAAIHAAIMELELGEIIEMTPGRIYQIK